MFTLFLCDPPESFIPYKDTTKVMMECAARRGLDVFTATHRHLEVRGNQVFVRARKLVFGTEHSAWFQAGQEQIVEVEKAHSIFFRHDPPFDSVYLHATHIVDLVDGPQVINSPHGLRYANEKLMTHEFSQWMPETFVSDDAERILDFIEDVGGRGVVKPVDGFGGQGIFVVRADDPNAGVILQTATADGWTVAQAYIPDVADGDMRILMMDGDVLGQFLRVPQPGEFRGNMMQGGTVEAIDLDDHSQKIIDSVRPRLQELGLRLVGLDIVGGFLTEVNVTSPTGFQEVNKLMDVRPEVLIWDKLLAS